MAGHSKWANIRHKKGKADAKRGKVFTRISKEITISAREGGGDPSANPRLRLAMDNARSANMPSDNIQRAIQRGTGELEGVSYEEITYEGYAPNGVAVIVETVTDNRNRTIAEMRHIFNKYGGSLGEANSVAWNFTRKGSITVKNPNNLGEEELLDVVLEAEADDVQVNEDTFTVLCDPSILAQCRNYLEENNYDIAESKFDFIPKTTVNLETANDARKVVKFMDVLEDSDDVQDIFANFDIADSIAAELE
jgi:YebC/PmpR family DNA-binding regulatory protein